MKFIHYDQRSDEWFEWRRTGVTASESPIILGLSPYQTPWQLWAEKTGFRERPDLSDNPNVRRGVLLEDDVRKLIAQQMCDIIEPACAEWDTDPTFKASFDGLTSDNTPVEIKCPSVGTFEDVKANGMQSKTVQFYRVQVMHQIMVADASHGWLCFFCNDELLKFDIPRDEALIQRIVNEGRLFWEKVLTKTEPELDPERDVFIPRDDDAVTWAYAARDWRTLGERIKTLQNEIERLEAQRDLLKPTFERMMGRNCAADFGGLAVRHSFVKGRIDYRKALEALLGRKPDEAELEQFRSAASERWSYRLTDSEVPKGILDEEVAQSAQVAPPVKVRWFS